MLAEPKDTPESPTTYKIKPGWLISPGAAQYIEKGGLSASEDHKVYLKIGVTFDVVDDVLMQTFTLDSAEVETSATLPESHEYTPQAATGDSYVILGHWENVAQQGEDEKLVFRHADCGSVYIKGCSSGATAALLSIRGA